MEFFHKSTNFPFMATRRIWYVLSLVLVVASIALFFVRGLNLTVDFTGGTNVEAAYPGIADVEKVRPRTGAERVQGTDGADLRHLA
ncbi:MAG: hypothetical protein WDO12_06180 [Pseudomonadota bacterium]